jgi:hypothetical protein
VKILTKKLFVMAVNTYSCLVLSCFTSSKVQMLTQKLVAKAPARVTAQANLLALLVKTVQMLPSRGSTTT